MGKRYVIYKGSYILFLFIGPLLLIVWSLNVATKPVTPKQSSSDTPLVDESDEGYEEFITRTFDPSVEWISLYGFFTFLAFGLAQLYYPNFCASVMHPKRYEKDQKSMVLQTRISGSILICMAIGSCILAYMAEWWIF